MSGRVGILTEFNYEDLELWYPYYRLREEGFDTFTIGPEKGKTYNSKHGYPCKAEEGIDNVNAKDLAGLIIPGGFAPDYWRRDKRFLDLVKDIYHSGHDNHLESSRCGCLCRYDPVNFKTPMPVISYPCGRTHGLFFNDKNCYF